MDEYFHVHHNNHTIHKMRQTPFLCLVCSHYIHLITLPYCKALLNKWRWGQTTESRQPWLIVVLKNTVIEVKRAIQSQEVYHAYSCVSMSSPLHLGTVKWKKRSPLILVTFPWRISISSGKETLYALCCATPRPSMIISQGGTSQLLRLHRDSSVLRKMMYVLLASTS